MKVVSRVRRLIQVAVVPLIVLTVLPAWGPWPDSPAGAQGGGIGLQHRSIQGQHPDERQGVVRDPPRLVGRFLQRLLRQLHVRGVGLLPGVPFAGAGRLLAFLAERGLERDTLVVFTSDNGPWLSYGNHAGSALPSASVAA